MMAWQVEMACHRSIFIVDDSMSVVIHALAKCLFCLPDVLFFAFQTCNQINNVVRETGDGL